MAITRSNHPDALWPGVKEWFGKKYAEHPEQYSRIFKSADSDKAYEKVIETTGFGLAPIKQEGAAIAYDTDGEGYANVFTHVVYGLGYVVTREELEDDAYTEVSERRAEQLAYSLRVTTETVHANILNRGFSGSYVYGDGVAMCSASHPTRSGNQSNVGTITADFSEVALEDMLKVIMQAQNNRGLRIALKGERLIVSTNDAFNAVRVLESQLRSGTANNDVNATKAMGLLPGGVEVNHYLSGNPWFIQTDCPAGLMTMWRRRAKLEKDNDFDTENAKAKATVRFSAGIGDWRAIYGNNAP